MLGRTVMCWVCDAEKPIGKMLCADEKYICDTKECLLGAFEKSVEERDFIADRLEVIRK